VPNPVTNEFVLLFSGYLAFSGVLNPWIIFLARSRPIASERQYSTPCFTCSGNTTSWTMPDAPDAFHVLSMRRARRSQALARNWQE
jgi:hypothetical protein